MKTLARLLIRKGVVSEQTMIVFLYRVFSAINAVKAELQALRWYAIIELYRVIGWTGAHAAAEWFSRFSGLRARLKAELGYGDEVDC